MHICLKGLNTICNEKEISAKNLTIVGGHFFLVDLGEGAVNLLGRLGVGGRGGGAAASHVSKK